MQRDMQKVLDMWGAWAASDACNIDYSSIAAGFKGLLPQASKMRAMCTDDDGLVIEGCMARLIKKCPYDYHLLVALYSPVFKTADGETQEEKRKANTHRDDAG